MTGHGMFLAYIILPGNGKFCPVMSAGRDNKNIRKGCCESHYVN